METWKSLLPTLSVELWRGSQVAEIQDEPTIIRWWDESQLKS